MVENEEIMGKSVEVVISWVQRWKSRQAGYEEEPKGVFELWEHVKVEWAKIEPEVCQGLIESMPRRIEAVLKAKGGHTKY